MHSRVPGCSPRAAFLHRSPAVISPPRPLQWAQLQWGAAQERDSGGWKGVGWLCAHGGKPSWGGPVAAVTRQKCSCPGHPWGASILLWCVGNCRLWVVSGFHVGCSPLLHLCILLCMRAQRRTMGMGTSEPYLLFLKKSLIAFCNCTVDKCSKST